MLALDLFLSDWGGEFLEEARLWRDGVRTCLGARVEALEGGGGASPKMKNLINAPINSTTVSCPTKKPVKKDMLYSGRLWTRRSGRAAGINHGRSSLHVSTFAIGSYVRTHWVQLVGGSVHVA
jgi:hypothetical protein